MRPPGQAFVGADVAEGVVVGERDAFRDVQRDQVGHSWPLLLQRHCGRRRRKRQVMFGEPVCRTSKYFAIIAVSCTEVRHVGRKHTKTCRDHDG